MVSHSSSENKRDGMHKSPWQQKNASVRSWIEEYSKKTFDVLIAGGGITGVTAALMLQKLGKSCILADAHNIGFGTTGGTSAHINTFADTTYAEAENAFGEEGAQLFADAIKEGYSIIENNVTKLGIDCDFEVKDGYLYAEDDKQAEQLRRIYESAVKYRVPVNFSFNVPVPIAYREALIFPQQAQFHPLRYLGSLADEYSKQGGIIVENFRVASVAKENGLYQATLGSKVIKAKNVFYATHVPPGVNIFSFRCSPYRSYVLGVSLAEGGYPAALVYDMQEPYHYFRTHIVGGKKYLIAGGCDHKTGHGDPQHAFKTLEQYVHKHFSVAEIAFRWSSQYYVPVDGLPYIGLMPGESNIFCATGYNGNGMMLGTIAAKVVADSIIGKTSKYQEIFNPSRLKPIAGFKEFIKENTDVIYQFIASRFSGTEIESVKKIAKGEGRVIELQGKQFAVFKADDGKIHALDPVCTHAGCVVKWNSEEKSWDCPCHGARYDIDGNILNGPAQMNLGKITLEMSEK